jgi:hypothetical protein
MSVSRVARQRAVTPHTCASCARSFVYPEFGVPDGDRWRVLLRCQSCGWSGERILDEEGLEKFERELDDERAQIEADLHRLTEHNMREYCELFVTALEADAVLPEDF